VYAIYRLYNQAREEASREKVYIFKDELITVWRPNCIVKKKRRYAFL